MYNVVMTQLALVENKGSDKKNVSRPCVDNIPDSRYSNFVDLKKYYMHVFGTI
jgi:hypothetical protein